MASPSDPESSLYDPPDEHQEDLHPEAEKEMDTLDLEIPKPLAHRLLKVSTHLGLSPSIVASRAVNLVCNEIGTIDSDGELSTQTLIQRFQARVDLFKIIEEADSSMPTSTAPADTDAPSDPTGSSTTSEPSSDGYADEELWAAVDTVLSVVSDGEYDPSWRHRTSGTIDVAEWLEETSDGDWLETEWKESDVSSGVSSEVSTGVDTEEFDEPDTEEFDEPDTEEFDAPDTAEFNWEEAADTTSFDVGGDTGEATEDSGADTAEFDLKQAADTAQFRVHETEDSESASQEADAGLFSRVTSAIKGLFGG